MELIIDRLGHLGDGLAAGPVFVDRTLPGEVVSGLLVGDRIENPRIITPSENRIASQCPAYKRCGGCSLHHAHPEFVAHWKQEVVLRALSAQGITVQIKALHTSPENSRRRAKLSGTRTKKGAIVGFFGKSSVTIQPIEPCKTLAPAILALVPALEDFTAKFGSRKGQLGFFVLVTDTGIDVAVDGLETPNQKSLVALAEWAGLSGVARLSVGEETVCEHQTPSMTFGAVNVSIPPRAFTQATTHGEAALQGAVARALDGAKSVIDLFSGVGTLGLPLTIKAKLHCVESDPNLLDALAYGVRHTQGVKKVTVEARDLFRNPVYHTDMKSFDAAIIDPPRAGAEQQVRQLAQSHIHNIAMVSCNPVTFARDARILYETGFKIKWLEVVDQFRWSSHIEIVAHFCKD
ncbi:MAG: class I SAM-dependent RNA methyltransferase, partial [Planktomarina sp.]|nr:class I SAM-dependent RNA methyltransferase [Planktomarina sp.]